MIFGKVPYIKSWLSRKLNPTGTVKKQRVSVSLDRMMSSERKHTKCFQTGQAGGGHIGFIAVNKVDTTVRKACQGCALCGLPPPKWPCFPGYAKLSNISRWDVMEEEGGKKHMNAR